MGIVHIVHIHRPIGLWECEITLRVSDGLTNGASDTISVVVKDGYTQFDEETYADIL